MPAKSKSHEAAQKKIWRAEIKQHEQSLKKVNADFVAEQRQRHKALGIAQKALAAEERKFARFTARRAKILPATIREIETRIAILRGRIDS
ncbi:hypothetical protein OKA04_04515 [Luteolibacter flavescens]|uniref:Uncharacterized protein n=1 Tax=Luteolibacter flavescens TaxID=1859460 RepID=A0ABT3FKW4_9BACT|nr:hypothetical protein [Luteolibacter flavescens]MCW1883979.1 hypothetical protein [Luteolibacter flavescens]